MGKRGQSIIRGNRKDNVIEGTSLDDIIYGKEGNDTLSGGDGNDVIYGGAGNDILSPDNGFDQLYGEAGNDHFYYVSDAFQNVPDQFIGGDGTDSITLDQPFGSHFEVQFVDQSGAFEIWDADSVVGSGSGIETFIVGNTHVFWLQANGLSAFGLTVDGRGIDANDFTQMSVIGSSLADVIYGGPQGDDLEGWFGADLITPGGGGDFLRPGGDGDRFIYTDLNDSIPTDPDQFWHWLGGDIIDVSDLGSFAYVGTTFTATGESEATIAGDYFSLDADGDGVADFSIQFSSGAPAYDPATYFGVVA